ncbi:MAG TPA: hypothetical protein VGS05_09835 [Candidatus Sulfotelmatobacter sp.]|nr:hypothetical protein [Candidatus Sulfotelmatobacter sp.]
MAIRSTHEAALVSLSNGAGAIRSSHESFLISVTAPLVGITYPLTAPAISGLGPQDFTMSEVNVVGETESPFTLSQQEQQWLGQMLRIEANLPPMLYAQAEQWISFLGALFGKFGTFLIGDYNRPTPQGPLSGSPVSIGGANVAGLNQLNVGGAAASIANWAVAGDYIQLTVPGYPQRIYKILQNASTDSLGEVVLQIFPNIRETIPSLTTIVTTNCKGTFRLQDNTLPWKVDKNKVYTVSFKAKEAI